MSRHALCISAKRHPRSDPPTPPKKPTSSSTTVSIIELAPESGHDTGGDGFRAVAGSAPFLAPQGRTGDRGTTLGTPTCLGGCEGPTGLTAGRTARCRGEVGAAPLTGLSAENPGPRGTRVTLCGRCYHPRFRRVNLNSPITATRPIRGLII